MNPAVSVIVPIYNMEAFIEPGVKALLAQTTDDFEVLFIDDGSTDHSAELCEAQIRNVPRFRLCRVPHGGSGPARNEGIRRSAGEFLYFFDIDDTLEPDGLERMVRAAREAKCDLLVFGYTLAYSKEETPVNVPVTPGAYTGDEVRQSYDRFMSGPMAIQGAPWNKLFRRQLAVDNHIEYPALRRHQDEGFVMRYVAHIGSVRIIGDVLYHHLGNTQARRWTKFPLDYYLNVEELCRLMEQTIMPWNPSNQKVLAVIGRIYYARTTDALKLLFNAKWGLSPGQRYGLLKERLARYLENAKRYPPDAGKGYNRLYPLITGNHPLLLYAALRHTTKRDARV